MTTVDRAPLPAGLPAPKDAPLSLRASVFTDEVAMDFAEACRTAAEAGLRYVDIRKLWGGFSHEVPRARWAEMAHILADHGLRIGAVQSNFGKCAIEGPEYEAHMRFFPILVEQARYFGTDTIRVFPFWNDVKQQYDPPHPGGIRPNLESMLPKIVRQIRPAVTLAEREGVFLGFEPEHTTYSGSPQEVARIVEAVGSPHLGVAWDANNGWDDATMEEAYALFKGRIVNVHVKERTISPVELRAARPALSALAGAGGGSANGHAAEPVRSAGSSTVAGPAVAPPADPALRLRRQPALLGTGAMPWPALIRQLERGGYHGVYSIETHFGTRGPNGWAKLKAATTYFMYALRELLEAAQADLAERPAAAAGAGV